MIRKLLILPALLLACSVSARAQGRIDVFGGYSFEHLGTSPSRNLNGLEITGQYKFTDLVGLAVDLDGHFGLPSQLDGRTLHFMVGPQISLPFRLSPFVHALGGIGHVSDAGIRSTSFSAAIGGGINMRVLPLLSWRIVQADDVITHFFGATQNSMRISTGLVLSF
jgi:hypothetical protein